MGGREFATHSPELSKSFLLDRGLIVSEEETEDTESLEETCGKLARLSTSPSRSSKGTGLGLVGGSGGSRARCDFAKDFCSSLMAGLAALWEVEVTR